MTIDEVIKILERQRAKVSARTLRTIRKIVALCQEYSYLGKKFTFDADEDLDNSVNKLLIALSDEILDDMYQKIEDFTEEEDKDAVLAYVGRSIGDKDITEAVDSHSSHLKYLLEGYLSVCFAERLSQGSILGDVLLYLSNPYQYQRMKEAFNDGEYSSGIIRSRGYHFGKGVATNPIDGFTNVTRNGILDGFHYGKWLGFRKEGYTAYEVHRGSSFDCYACDNMCYSGTNYRKYPIDVPPPCPLHPNCCCYMVPVK